MTTVIFTEKEKEYIIKEPFNWHMAEDTPEDVKKTLTRKLELLKPKKESVWN